jgi:hypothetical protein
MDALLLERVQDEVSDIKAFNSLGPDQPVSYKPEAVTRRGYTD